MVETKLKEEKKDEFQQIMEHIRRNENFLLSGGAGSGKTFSLVQVIRKITLEFPFDKVACMTYTNAAVKEIEERVNHPNLNVTTIHDFLWDNIKHYQKELKDCLIELINDETCDKVMIAGGQKIEADFFEEIPEINYSYQRTQLSKGIISHDELLLLANRMFKSSKLLCEILIDKFKFIFIDEYQDTHPEVVEIFLDHITQSSKKNITGFFGDSMQSIYDDGIGDLKKYIDSGLVKEVKKVQNRRNPQLVIDLANKLRNDGLIQQVSEDKSAPNMDENGIVKQGKILFTYAKTADTEKVKTYLKVKYNWDFLEVIDTKELNLTHNLIAKKAGFSTLMNIYNSDKILEYKNKILKELKEKPNIEIKEEDTFGDVIQKVNLSMTNPISAFISMNSELFERAKTYKFSVFRNIHLDSDILTDDKKQEEDDNKKKGSKRDALLKHLFKIQNNIRLYSNGNHIDFLRQTEYFKYLKEQNLIFNVEMKKKLKGYIEDLIVVNSKTIEDVIEEAHNKGICLKDDKLLKFINEKDYAYYRIKRVKFSEFQNVYCYLEGLTPFSTQHKVKGDEFDNVLVILDNGNWNKYNFEYLFDKSNQESLLIAGKSITKSKLESFYKTLPRTQKIFYVCCTRAKENLAVYYNDPSPAVIKTAESWFGKDCVIPLD